MFGKGRADFLGRLDDGTLVHVELQVQHDPTLPERMVEYFLAIRQRFGQTPVQILLYLGDGPVPYDGTFKAGPLSFTYTVKDLKELNCEFLLNSPDPNDNILAVLCRRSEGFWERLSERLMRLPETERMDFVQRVSYLVKLRRDLSEEYEALRKEVRSMPIVIDLEKDPAYRTGIEKGLIVEARELVIEALEERFGSVPEDIKQKINSIEDRAVLKRLHRLAIRAGSLEDFRQGL